MKNTLIKILVPFLCFIIIGIIVAIAQDKTKTVTGSQDKVKIKNSQTQTIWDNDDKQIAIKKAKVDSLYKEIAKANQSIKNYSYEIVNLQKEISLLEKSVWERKMKK